MTRSFFYFLSPPGVPLKTFLSKAETAPLQQVTNCGRYFDGGSLLWTSLQITKLRARPGAVVPPSGSFDNVGFTRNGRRQFKGSVRSRLFHSFFFLYVDGARAE